MYEMTEGTLLVTELAIERGRVTELQQQLDGVRAQRDSYIKLYNEAREYIQTSIDSDDWSDSELDEPFWEKLADLLDLTIKQQVEVTITTYWRGTVTMPKGMSVSDLADYISIDDPELSHSSAELSDVEIRDTSVDRY